ncbi:hypothetical protein LZG74_25530 [Dyadobacter sp. CY327]|uniref:hypothetical protein n=1 Tax=Dyadobacter sp. CY327 TaxID=2907301 RepID=UPI001F3EB06B|nr:hypothetical protein [Dyadobacter sp. CY327]MCE7073697.1 hypothetical protein [Dyadobacter sp. CY327]
MEIPNNFIDWIVTALAGLVGYLWKTINGRIDGLTDRFNKHEIHVANTYPTKDDVRSNFKDIKETLKDQTEKLDQIVEKLANKEDRKRN